ncbi:hypothetical protein ACFL4Q_00965 [candidate division KSB1 bacterium]
MTIFCNFRTILPVLALLLFSVKSGSTQEPKIGDVSDGSRSRPVHLLVLYDEEGALISPGDRIPMPFSPKQTCLECHDYAAISGGWHFNAAQLGNPGRRGEPWVLSDPVSATQIPLSRRSWPGTFKPEDFGLTPFLFTEKFGRHLTGGGVSENDSTETPDMYVRWMVSGKAEINCLSCHDADPGHDQAEYDLQMRRQNYRWAAAATSGFASVSGSAKAMPDFYDIYSGAFPDIRDAVPPSVEYDNARFDAADKVLFDITREAPDDRCYFCHSAKNISGSQPDRWEIDEDVHLASGLTCVDCHRNGLDHMMIRGYEWEAENRDDPAVAAFSCEGCHLGDETIGVQGGRLGAPFPLHKGMPAVHFEKLACTACHSGPLPEEYAQGVKLSRAHALGTHDVKKGDDAAPYIVSPIYIRDDDGKIAPHRLIWPSFWAFMNGDSVRPAAPDYIQKISLTFIVGDTLTDSTNIARLREGNWPRFSEKQVVQILDSLNSVNTTGDIPVFISGGKLFSSDGSAGITARDHPAAQPYAWAFAHDVRPAEQSLGIKDCGDCHSVDAAFSFGKVTAPVPFGFSEGRTLSMTSFQDVGALYPRLFALAFLFKPLVKYLIIASTLVILLVLLLYTLKGLEAVIRTWSGIDS